MGDFYRRPLEKKMNKGNIISRIEAVERAQSAPPKMQVGSFEEVGGNLDLAKNVSVDSDLFSSPQTPNITSVFTRPDQRVGMGWTIFSGNGATNVVQGIGCDPVFGVTAPASISIVAQQFSNPDGTTKQVLTKSITYNAAANGAWVWPTAIVITPQLDPYWSGMCYCNTLTAQTTIYMGITSGASATPKTGVYALFSINYNSIVTFETNYDGSTITDTYIPATTPAGFYRGQIWIDSVNKRVLAQLDYYGSPNATYTSNMNPTGAWTTTAGRAFMGCVVTGAVAGNGMSFVRGYTELG